MTNDYQALFEDKCKECENLTSENALLKRDIENLQEMVDELQTDVETYQELNDEMTSEIETKDTEFFDLQEELDRIQAEFGRKCDKYIKQIQDLQKELEEHKKSKVQMETQIEKFVRNERLITNRAERAEHKLADIEEDMIILKSQFEDERDSLEEQILRQDGRIKDFEDDVRVKTKRIKDLEGSIPDVDPTPEVNDARRKESIGDGVAGGDAKPIDNHSQYGRLEATVSDASVTGETFSCGEPTIEVSDLQSKI